MTTYVPRGPRRLRAALIGFALDGRGDQRRIITGKDCLVLGGSAETHAEILETLLRLETELERLGRRLGEVAPAELAEIALRIDSPELEAIALRLETGLERLGHTFSESAAEELTELATGPDF